MIQYKFKRGDRVRSLITDREYTVRYSDKNGVIVGDWAPHSPEIFVHVDPHKDAVETLRRAVFEARQAGVLVTCEITANLPVKENL